MAPFNPNATPRFWVDYRAQGRNHSVMFRYVGGGLPDGSPGVPFQDGVIDFFDVMEPWLPADFEILATRRALQAQDFSLPSVGLGTFSPTGVAQAGEMPAFLTFVGRSTSGTAWKLTLLGVTLSPVGDGAYASDYRIQAGENAVIDGARAVLQAIPGLVAIDGMGIIVYPYVNSGFNAYWQRKARG